MMNSLMTSLMNKNEQNRAFIISPFFYISYHKVSDGYEKIKNK